MTVVTVGTETSSGSLSIVIPAGQIIAIGATLLVSVSTSADRTMNVTDERGNTYVQIVRSAQTTTTPFETVAVFRCDVTTTLQSGDEITVTANVGGTTFAAAVHLVTVGATSDSAITGANGRDLAAGPADVPENGVAWAAFSVANPDLQIDPGAGWTLVGVVQPSSGRALAIVYADGMPSGPVTATADAHATHTWAGGLVTFAPAAGQEPPPPPPQQEGVTLPAPTRRTPTPQWRYLFCDLLTDAPLCMLPMSGVTMDRRLSSAGALSGTIAIPNPALAAQAKLITAQRTAVYALRADDGSNYRPWWGGIVWSAPVESSAAGGVAMTVTAATFESFLGRGYLETDLPDQLQIDQLDIARTLWTERQSQPAGDIGVVLGDELSGVLRDRTEYQVANAVNLGEALDNLAALDDGFEYTIDVYVDTAGARVKLLRLGYPTVDPDPGFMPLFSMGPGGGRLLSWKLTPDGTAGDTVFYARGQADNSNSDEDAPPPISTAQPAQELLDAGWPRLVRIDDYSTVSKVSTLNAHARGTRKVLSGAVQTWDATVSVTGTSWTPNLLGAQHRFVIDDAWSERLTTSRRVVGYSITPPERGQAETVALTFDSPADDAPGAML